MPPVNRLFHRVEPDPPPPFPTLDSLTQVHIELLTWDAFVLFQIGIWFWEYANTFRMDWRLLSRQYRLRPSGASFLIARFSLTGLFAGQVFLVQNIIIVNCQAVWIVLVVAGSLAVSASNAIYCLRALAVWSNRLRVLVPIVSLWLVQLCIWCLDIVSLSTQGQRLPVLGFSCSSFTAAKYSAIPFLLTISVDVTATSLIIIKLCKRTKSPGAPTLRRLLLRDAVVYSAVSIGPSIVAPVLFWVTEEIILRTLMVSFALLVHVILSSRAFIALHNAGPLFPDQSRTVIRNGELLDRDALDRFTAARMGAWSGMGGGGCGRGPELPRNVEAQRQVSQLYKHFRYPEQVDSEKMQGAAMEPSASVQAMSSDSDAVTLDGGTELYPVKSGSTVTAAEDDKITRTADRRVKPAIAKENECSSAFRSSSVPRKLSGSTLRSPVPLDSAQLYERTIAAGSAWTSSRSKTSAGDSVDSRVSARVGSPSVVARSPRPHPNLRSPHPYVLRGRSSADVDRTQDHVVNRAVVDDASSQRAGSRRSPFLRSHSTDSVQQSRLSQNHHGNVLRALASTNRLDRAVFVEGTRMPVVFQPMKLAFTAAGRPEADVAHHRSAGRLPSPSDSLTVYPPTPCASVHTTGTEAGRLGDDDSSLDSL